MLNFKTRLALQTFPTRLPIIKQRQGFISQGSDLRYFKKAILDGSCIPVESLLLRHAFREARVIRDPAANEKISKDLKRMRGRDDALSGRCNGRRSH